MESKLQRKIIQDLRKNGWVALKVIRCNISGWPDVTAYRNKKAVFIEVKDEGEEADDLQQLRHDELRAQGFEVYVIDTWEQYKTLSL